MPDQFSSEEVAAAIHAALQEGNVDAAVEKIVQLFLPDQAEVFLLLDQDEQELLLKHLDIPSTADLFDELEDDETLEAASSLTIERLADVLDEMQPDEAADLLGDLPPETATEALQEMDDPDDVIPLLAYPDETAGGRMTTSYVAMRRLTTAQQAINFLRDVGPHIHIPYYLFVIDREKKLAGVVGFRELVIASPQANIEDIMNPEVLFVTSETDQEEAARTMARYDLSAVPVVDDDGKLLGVITHDDLVDVLEEEATEDIYRLAKVADADLEPDSTVGAQLKGRLPWLYLSTITALFAAWIISQFEALIAQVAVLAVFQSVVAGLGGNAVTQNMAMVVRSIALDKINRKRIWPIIFKQAFSGLLIGIAVGVVVGFGVYFWKGNAFLGLVLGLALVGNMIVAGIAGTLVPLGLHALGKDPALASAVLVTTATDSMGFLIFLGLAQYFLPQLR